MNTKYLIISLVLALFTVSVSAYALNVEDSILCDNCGMYYENTFEHCPYCENPASSVENETPEPDYGSGSGSVTEPENVAEPETELFPELEDPVIEDDGTISGEITDPVTGERLTVDLSSESVDMLAATLASEYVPQYSYQHTITTNRGEQVLIDTFYADFFSSKFNVVVLEYKQYQSYYKLVFSDKENRYFTYDGVELGCKLYYSEISSLGSYTPRVLQVPKQDSSKNLTYNLSTTYNIVWANVDVVTNDGVLVFDSTYDGSGGTVTPVCTCSDRCTTSDYDATCPVCSNDIAGCTGEVIEPDPECNCEDRCTVDNVNASCPVCSESIDGCLGEAVIPDPPDDPDPEPVYTITFVTGFDDVVIGARYSDTFVAPRPYKAGYMFTGWYLDEDLTQPYTTDYVFTADTVLYASWSDAPIMVSFQKGIFDSLTQLLSCEPVVYVLSLMGMVFIFGIVRKFVIPLIT